MKPNFKNAAKPYETLQDRIIQSLEDRGVSKNDAQNIMLILKADLAQTYSEGRWNENIEDYSDSNNPLSEIALKMLIKHAEKIAVEYLSSQQSKAPTRIKTVGDNHLILGTMAIA